MILLSCITLSRTIVLRRENNIQLNSDRIINIGMAMIWRIKIKLNFLDGKCDKHSE